MASRKRRKLSLGSLEELRAEVERLANVERNGRLNSVGHWTLGQCCQHLGRVIAFSLDGFPFQYPWHLRLAARLVRLISWKLLVRISLVPGFSNPSVASAIEPDAVVSTNDGIAFLEGQLERLSLGERMCQPSPAEGPLSHDQWLYFHLRHAELHLSFQVTAHE